MAAAPATTGKDWNCVLHVKGLPAGVTDEQLRAVINQVKPGVVLTETKVLPEKKGKELGAAIITTGSADDATFLIENAKEPLVITKKSRQSRGGWGMAYSWGGGLPSFAAEKKVWVGGLPETGITFTELQAHFPGCKFATIMGGNGKGTGGVAYATAEEATAAIQTLNGSELMGHKLWVDVWTKKEKAPAAESL